MRISWPLVLTSPSDNEAKQTMRKFNITFGIFSIINNSVDHKFYLDWALKLNSMGHPSITEIVPCLDKEKLHGRANNGNSERGAAAYQKKEEEKTVLLLVRAEKSPSAKSPSAHIFPPITPSQIKI